MRLAHRQRIVGGSRAFGQHALDDIAIADVGSQHAPTGRKAIQLTEEGRTYVTGHAEEMAAVWAPFAEQDDDDEAVNFKQVIGQTVGAIVQVATTGTPDQRQKAIDILGDTRRRLYGLLAEGPDAAEDEDSEEE